MYYWCLVETLSSSFKMKVVLWTWVYFFENCEILIKLTSTWGHGDTTFVSMFLHFLGITTIHTVQVLIPYFMEQYSLDYCHNDTSRSANFFQHKCVHFCHFGVTTILRFRPTFRIVQYSSSQRRVQDQNTGQTRL